MSTCRVLFHHILGPARKPVYVKVQFLAITRRLLIIEGAAMISKWMDISVVLPGDEGPVCAVLRPPQY
jgi:hypothetical protein